MARPRKTETAAASDTSPADGAEKPKRKRGRPPNKMRVTAAPRTHANGHAKNGHNGAELIVMPRTGPGKRRMVQAGSLDGFAAQLATKLANEIAPRIVNECRAAAESMVRASLDSLFEKL